MQNDKYRFKIGILEDFLRRNYKFLTPAFVVSVWIGIFLFLISFQILPQSQEEILRDLREENAALPENQSYPKNFYLEKLRTIYALMITALESRDDKLAIKEANQMEIVGIDPMKIKIYGYAELGEEQILYLKIRKLRGEAYYNLREFKNALPDSRFIVENHPRPVIFDFTRYAVSLYYSGDEKIAKKILGQAKVKFKNENDRAIIKKTDKILFLEN